MTGDPNSPYSPAWWWSAVLVPLSLGVRWLVSVGRDGSQNTIRGQQDLLATLRAENMEQAKRIAALETRCDQQGQEIDRLRRELGVQAGGRPAA